MSGAIVTSGDVIHAERARAGLPDCFVVTIDGQAATGKSSVGLRLAQRLGAAFLDTGAMYRDATALAIEHHVAPQDAEGITRLVAQTRAGMDWVASPGNNYRGLDAAMSARLRTPGVDAAVSIVARHEGLRLLLIDWQRGVARAHKRLVTEGRDQGSRVFRETALAKFFLMAEPGERARRRVEQLRAAGVAADAGAIEANLRLRDAIDASHAMKIAEGMAVIDTTHLTEDAVVDRLAGLVLVQAGRAGV